MPGLPGLGQHHGRNLAEFVLQAVQLKKLKMLLGTAPACVLLNMHPDLPLHTSFLSLGLHTHLRCMAVATDCIHALGWLGVLAAGASHRPPGHQCHNLLSVFLFAGSASMSSKAVSGAGPLGRHALSEGNDSRFA